MSRVSSHGHITPADESPTPTTAPVGISRELGLILKVFHLPSDHFHLIFTSMRFSLLFRKYVWLPTRLQKMQTPEILRQTGGFSLNTLKTETHSAGIFQILLLIQDMISSIDHLDFQICSNGARPNLPNRLHSVHNRGKRCHPCIRSSYSRQIIWSCIWSCLNYDHLDCDFQDNSNNHKTIFWGEK